MGWFEEQIQVRMKNDEEGFAEAFADMSSVIMGEAAWNGFQRAADGSLKDAIGQILSYYRVRQIEEDGPFRDLNEQLDFHFRPLGIMHRRVKLSGCWYRDGIGPLLARDREGEPVALIPAGRGGYNLFARGSRRPVRVTERSASVLDEEAVCFYRPFPLREMNGKDFISFLLAGLSAGDLMAAAAAAVLLMLPGLLNPAVSKMIFQSVIPGGGMQLMGPLFFLLLCLAAGTVLLGMAKGLVSERIAAKQRVSAEAAAMMRLLSLPPVFFKRYSSGELLGRVRQAGPLSQLLIETVLTIAFTVLLSAAYIIQIFFYAPVLGPAALLFFSVSLLVVGAAACLRMGMEKKRKPLAARQSGLELMLISGIQKIKLAGAEKRAFTRWAKAYRSQSAYRYHPPLLLRMEGVILTLAALLVTAAVYGLAADHGLELAQFMAFQVSFGMLGASVAALSKAAEKAADIPAMFDLLEPILREKPELAGDRKTVRRLSGGLELNGVSFRYQESLPMLLDNLSLKIRPGEYVAVTGKSGSGKSTLLRLLLGFETPLTGVIYYDGKDISSLDLQSLRQKIGVVMQNEKIFQGSIYSNIVLSAPWLTMEEAWEAARLAGLEEDIRSMPMGMHTVVSEGEGLSGGQKQRLIIARAIAPKPKLLFFDEATSALDNITQKIVSDALKSLKCTRVVIAHRLSTIWDCDRLLVLENGRIAEEGTCDELIKKDGLFARLVDRQIISSDTSY